MYYNDFDDEFLIVLLYVDDLILTGIQLTFIQKMKSNIKNKFEMTSLCLLHYFGSTNLAYA